MAGYYSGRRKLYRSRNGEILGVCKGIAEWRDFPVDTVRLIFILLVLFGGMSIWVYFILALVIPVEPEYREDGRRSRRSRSSDTGSADAEYEDLKERVRRMEDEEFDKERDWDNRFGK
jgi:phage shock protein C